MGEVSILWFKKAQVFCIKNSSCVKTGKSLRAIETLKRYSARGVSPVLGVKTGKSLRAIETSFPQQNKPSHNTHFRVKTGKSLRAIETFFIFTSTFASTNVKN